MRIYFLTTVCIFAQVGLVPYLLFRIEKIAIFHLIPYHRLSKNQYVVFLILYPELDTGAQPLSSRSLKIKYLN